MKVRHNIELIRTTLVSNAFLCKVCLLDKSVFLIYQAIYLFLYSYTLFFVIELLALSDI